MVKVISISFIEFDTQGILQMPIPSYDRPSSLKSDAGYLVHYDDPTIESKLTMMRMKVSTKRDFTAVSMELDQVETASEHENFRVKGNEEVEINRDGFVVDIREVTVDRLRAVCCYYYKYSIRSLLLMILVDG